MKYSTKPTLKKQRVDVCHLFLSQQTGIYNIKTTNRGNASEGQIFITPHHPNDHNSRLNNFLIAAEKYKRYNANRR
jgi:hypothetical protein